MTEVTAKIVRQNMEAKFNADLSDRKQEIDHYIMHRLEKQSAEDSLTAAAIDDVATGNGDAGEHATPRRGRKKKQKDGEEGELDENGNPKKEKKKRKPREPQYGPDGEKIVRRTGLTVPMLLSDQLSNVIGVVEMSRCDVVKSLWKYIKEHQLQDPEDKRYFLCDDKLLAVFGKPRLSGFEMNKYISGHMQKLERKEA